jgi:hypothetical protein
MAFRVGDIVELRVRAVVTVVHNGRVAIRIDEGNGNWTTTNLPERFFVNMSDAREMSEEEAKRLLSDEL